MHCGLFIQERRRDLGLGLREVSRRTEHLKTPISASYLSRLESGDRVDISKVSLDTLWSIGIELEVDPLKLFVLAHNLTKFAEPSARDRLFPNRDVIVPCSLGDYLKERREMLSMGLRELSSRVESSGDAVFSLSPGFLSQVENDVRDQSSRVSGEKLWALGVVLGVDPLCLFVLSRQLDPRFLRSEVRDRYFRIR